MPGPSYNIAMVTLNAHFDGKSIVLDEPYSLKTGTRLKVIVDTEPRPEPQAPQVFRPLNIQIDPELANAIALNKEF
jgi:hypothetical protein